MEMQRHGIPKLAASIAVCLSAGFAGSAFTAPAIPAWYATLAKPSFSPPDWVFAPVWTALFTLMGASAYLIWMEAKRRDVRRAAYAFAAQLALNVLWSFIFFGLRSPVYAFAEIIALWAAIAITFSEFSKVSRTAGLLLVPYIAWVSFAAFLNFSVWQLNT
jgi:tryptophan-rich sensory protein